MLIFPSKTLSRIHAILEAKDAHNFLIHDEGSSNKSWRNAIQLEPQIRYACEDKDQLTFGEVKMRLIVHDSTLEEEENEGELDMPATQLMSKGLNVKLLSLIAI